MSYHLRFMAENAHAALEKLDEVQAGDSPLDGVVGNCLSGLLSRVVDSGTAGMQAVLVVAQGHIAAAGDGNQTSWGDFRVEPLTDLVVAQSDTAKRLTAAHRAKLGGDAPAANAPAPAVTVSQAVDVLVREGQSDHAGVVLALQHAGLVPTLPAPTDKPLPATGGDPMNGLTIDQALTFIDAQPGDVMHAALMKKYGISDGVQAQAGRPVDTFNGDVFQKTDAFGQDASTQSQAETDRLAAQKKAAEGDQAASGTQQGVV